MWIPACARVTIGCRCGCTDDVPGGSGGALNGGEPDVTELGAEDDVAAGDDDGAAGCASGYGDVALLEAVGNGVSVD